MNEDDVMYNIYLAIVKAIEQKLNLIGSVIEGEARAKILEYDIRDKGDFYQNTGYELDSQDNYCILEVGSGVKHQDYVLGGKEPSWTPIEPLKAWVERKQLSWVDKNNKVLSVDSIAYLIRSKIKREGIPARNVFAEVIKNREEWIYKQLDNIQVTI